MSGLEVINDRPRNRLRIALVIAIALAIGWSAPRAFAQELAGSKTWGAYSFNWAIQNSSGLSIQDVTYNDTYYIYNASLPVIRVQYDNDACGPFMDRLGTAFIVQDETGQYIRFAEADGKLYVSIKAQISAYALEQQWVFSPDGRIDARLFSSGLQCLTDHRHHPYWRIDPDISGTPEYDEIRVRYADGCTQTMKKEFNRRKDVSPNVSWWAFRDKRTGRQLLVVPGSTDGTADNFGSYDFYGRAFHEPWEQDPWASETGGSTDQGDLVVDSANGETTGPGTAMTDVVGWYSAHLVHRASTGSMQLISAGPALLLR